MTTRTIFLLPFFIWSSWEDINVSVLLLCRCFLIKSIHPLAPKLPFAKHHLFQISWQTQFSHFLTLLSTIDIILSYHLTVCSYSSGELPAENNEVPWTSTSSGNSNITGCEETLEEDSRTFLFVFLYNCNRFYLPCHESSFNKTLHRLLCCINAYDWV